ncbi:unnamed protein product [Sphagnum jensenii]|uniref:UBA domain-containing protein n=1 Tax=Sphagnum jensenii TaxID=128206 RepID=A0ABP1BJL0_9BRYO
MCLYLAVPPPDAIQQAKHVDEDVLQDVVCLGFDRTQLAESLVNHAQNKPGFLLQATIAYYLILDNCRSMTKGDEVAPWFSLIVEVLFVVLVSSQRKHLKTFGDLDMGLKKTARAFKAIEAAIKWGLKKVEAGAQGEHKKTKMALKLLSDSSPFRKEIV